MCAKKKANFASWPAIWLSFKRRKYFLKQFFKCFYFYATSVALVRAVIPKKARCCERCSVGMVMRLGLVALNMNFLLTGITAIRSSEREMVWAGEGGREGERERQRHREGDRQIDR